MRIAYVRLLTILLALCILIGACIVVAGYLLAMPGLSSWHIGGQMAFNTALLLIGVGAALLNLALLTDPCTRWEEDAQWRDRWGGEHPDG